MSDEEVEQFEISDYDYHAAMNPGFKHKRMNKEEATYGIWAAKEYDSDDDEEDDDEGFRNKKKPKSNNGFGISFDSDEDLPKIVKEKTTMLNRKKQYSKGKTNDAFLDKEFGNWEKFTTGFGSKMLKKMGYKEGKGLGSKGQGIIKPVEAKLRKGKGAVGMYGNEAPEKETIKNEETQEADDAKHVPQWRQQGQKKTKTKYIIKTAEEILVQDFGGERIKTQSQTKNSIVSGVSTSKIKIIDMTGKEQKILQGYESLSKRHNKPYMDNSDEDTDDKIMKMFNLPELLHNLDALVNLTEDKIFQSDKQMKYHEDMIFTMLHEEKRIDEIIYQESQQINSMNKLLQAIEECEKSIKEGNKTMDEYIEVFKDLKENYYNEYKLYNLNDLCLPLLSPLFSSYYSNWNPFINRANLTVGYNTFKEWKNLLEDTNSVANSGFLSVRGHQMDSYHRLVWENLMPPIRRALLSCDMRKCDNIIDFIEIWTPLLPRWIIENILEQLILPKLTSEVEKWNPLTDTVPIHAWIHPWLPFLKERLEPLYAPIRYKLSNALINWHPSDESAKAILLPWKAVFSTVTWDTFMKNNILPKLKICLEEFTINPRQQNLDPWKWVISWENLIPDSYLIDLLDQYFFPKWLHVLSVWLNANPNYEEISKWYLGWKNLFSIKLTNNPIIKARMTLGLTMMNKSVGGSSVGYTPTRTQPLHNVSSTENIQSQFLQGVQISSNTTVINFKDMIEKRAAELNLIFLQLQGRFHEGKQIYKLGNLNILIDQNVIFILKNGLLSPSSLNEVIEKAL